jgi:thymidylate kinase
MTPEQINERLDMERQHLDIVIERLENKIDAKFNAVDARFNAIDAKFNNQKILIIVAILSVLAQIVNAWIIHLKP